MQQEHVKIELSLRLPCVIIKRRKWFVSGCRALDVWSQGDTEKEAKRNLKEALLVFLTTCLEMGTLDTVLKACGFELAWPPETMASRTIKKPENYIDVSIPFMTNTTRCSHKVSCRA